MGDIAEIKFHLEAHQRGFNLSKPLRAIPYDFIVDTGTRLVRVQIKSTGFRNEKCYMLDTRRSSIHRQVSKKRYAPGEIDVIVAYVHPENAWYIVPFSEISGTHMRLYPHCPGFDGKYERFRDAWNLLEG